MAIMLLMTAAYFVSNTFPGMELKPDPHTIMMAPAVFAFGLVAFGFLGMGPVTIAVDSYGPVTDNAQSVFELSTIETTPNIRQDIQKNFGFEPNFEKAKEFLGRERRRPATPSRPRPSPCSSAPPSWAAHDDGVLDHRGPHPRRLSPRLVAFLPRCSIRSFLLGLIYRRGRDLLVHRAFDSRPSPPAPTALSSSSRPTSSSKARRRPASRTARRS